MKRFIFSTFCFLLCTVAVEAQTFDAFFKDSTLRIDYIFAGNSKEQNIYVDKLNMSPRWFGKRKRLAEVPVEGNGQITVRSHRTGEVIFRNSFSTLFQEWLSYDEATTARKSFQNSFLIPMPNDTVDVTVDLRNNRRHIITSLKHQIAPSDILIRHIGFEHVTPYVTIQTAKDTANCIRIAYVAEGYQKDEMNTFLNDAKTATEALFEHEPLKTLRNRFNIIAVESPSVDSGTSEPSHGVWKETVLHSHFDTFYSARYLTTLNINQLHDILAGTPYEHLMILVNTNKYGGGGILNSYNLSMTHHPAFRSVVVHEFGHSFAGLGDEYAYEQEQIPMYPHDVEPWEPNLTTLHNFHNKWEKMIAKGTPIPTPPLKNFKRVGIFEGAGYSLKGVYRGQQDCRMRSNEYPEFCAVCQEAIRRLIQFYTE